MVDVDIQAIVDHLGKRVIFLQPLYEAIANSLEASATKIRVSFETSISVNEEIRPSIIGFTITDNGEGFTSDNRVSFGRFWTAHKAKIGCKGSGRFTWLEVFKTIQIESHVKAENVVVTIPFDLSFNKEKIYVKQENVTDNLTSITFSDVTEKFYAPSPAIGKGVDKRADADIDQLVSNVQDYLLIKLFLLKKEKVPFEIEFCLNEKTKIINWESIPPLSEQNFQIKSQDYPSSFDFVLYYQFISDGKNSKKICYCSNSRSTKTLEGDDFGFTSPFPNEDSLLALVCSSYLNDKDDDSRTDFTELSHLRSETIDCPLLFSDITQEVRGQLNSLVKAHYPNIAEVNHSEEENAINTAPYLSKYIKQNNDVVKSHDSLIEAAKKNFENEKTESQQKFQKLLSDKSVDPAEFNDSVSKLSEVAATELGEYVFYRDSILHALQLGVADPEKKEAFFHNIFMPMQTDCHPEDAGAPYLNNLWILDDKFMTFSFAASDEAYKCICKHFLDIDCGGKRRPDLLAFFNSNGTEKDVIITEFKGASASFEQKNKALTEILLNTKMLRKDMPNIRTVWGYIITTLDNPFIEAIEVSGNYISLFSEEDKFKSYYGFFKTVNLHVFILDYDAIVSNALARNKTFIDILKKS